VLVPVLVITVLGVCGGLVAGTISLQIFQSVSRASGQRRDLARSVRLSSLVVGGFSSGGAAAMVAFDAAVPLSIQSGAMIVVGGFFFTAVESLCRLKLASIFHPQAVEVGELSLLAAVVLLAALYLVGVLWVSMIVVGLGTVLTAALLGGQYLCGYMK
jgi:hypothetical protein